MSPDGLLIIAGGKLTTYRRMAREAVEKAAVWLSARGCAYRPLAPTHQLPLPGANGLETDADFATLQAKLSSHFCDAEIGKHLAKTYGVRALRILDLAKPKTHEATPIVEGLPYIWAEVVYAVREEMAVTLEDILQRRTKIYFRDRSQGLSVADEIARQMGQALSWSPREEAERLETYRALVEANRSWKGADL